MTATSIGSSGAIPDGEIKQFVVEGEKVAVANVAGVFHAIGDVCTHKACPLSKGSLEGTTVTCPCHGSEFDVTTGEVLKGPAEQAVPTYPISVENDQLVVQL